LSLTAICLLELLNPEAPFLRSLAGLRSWILYAWLMFSGYEMLRSPRQIKQIYFLILSLCILTALYGLYQWHQGPAALKGQSEVLDQYAERMNWEEQGTGSVFRAFSTFVQPGTFGYNMSMGLIVTIVLLSMPSAGRPIKALACV